MTGRYPMRHGLQVGVVRPVGAVRPAAGGADAAAGAQGGRLRHRHRRQVAPRPLPARVPADAPRLRPPVRPLQRRARLLHPHPRRRLRLAPRRQGLPRRGLQRRTCSAKEAVRHRRRARREEAAVPVRPVQRRPRAAPGAGEVQGAVRRSSKEPRRTYAGMLAAMDEAIGQIVAAVDEEGHAQEHAVHLLQRQRRPAAGHA